MPTVVIAVKSHALSEKLQIVGTLDRHGPRPGLSQSRQQHSRKNGDDGNDHEKLY